MLHVVFWQLLGEFGLLLLRHLVTLAATAAFGLFFFHVLTDFTFIHFLVSRAASR